MAVNVLDALEISIEKSCYGPEGSEALRKAIADFCDWEADVYRGDGFVLTRCPCCEGTLTLWDGDLIVREKSGQVSIFRAK